MPPKVLIIDDWETDRYLFRQYLETSAFQYEVFEAKDGESGLRVAEEVNPDCILLDLNLAQGQSGYEVLADLLGLERPPKRTVIVLTGLGKHILEQGALSLGAAGFLEKSKTDAASLDMAIRQAISNCRGR